MKIILVIITIIFIFTSCWTKQNPIDSILMSKIEKQAALDSLNKTSIELFPRKKYLGHIERRKTIEDQFWIKNIGKIDFNIISIESPCDCVEIKFVGDIIRPNDSLLINYSIRIDNNENEVKQAIIVIGNCDYGNQTFYTEAFIIP